MGVCLNVQKFRTLFNLYSFFNILVKMTCQNITVKQIFDVKYIINIIIIKEYNSNSITLVNIKC